MAKANIEKLKKVLTANPRNLADKSDMFLKYNEDEYKSLVLFALETLCKNNGSFNKSRTDGAGWAAHAISKQFFEGDNPVNDRYADRAFIEQAAGICPWYIRRYLPDDWDDEIIEAKMKMAEIYAVNSHLRVISKGVYKEITKTILRCSRKYHDELWDYLREQEAGRPIPHSVIRESTHGTVPRFVHEDYALYEGGEFYKSNYKGKEIIIGKKKGMDFIGVKPDAPQWAHDEYEEWLDVEAETWHFMEASNPTEAHSDNIKNRLSYTCPMVNRVIDMGDCADVQQARLGLLKKSSVDIVEDWDSVGDICDQCEYRQ